jgi:metal-responsive CopG/Arc/MetJ family transcriptional regulator
MSLHSRSYYYNISRGVIIMAKGVLSISVPLDLAVQIERMAKERGCSISFMVEQLLKKALKLEEESDQRDSELLSIATED